MEESLKNGLFDAVKNENFARCMGFVVKQVDDGFAEVEMVYVPEKMNNLFGTAHGGAIFSLIDEAFQVACQTHGTIAVALNVNVTYLAAPKPGSRLKAVAREINRTRKTAIYEIRVTDTDDLLIATCQALSYRTGKPLPFPA